MIFTGFQDPKCSNFSLGFLFFLFFFCKEENIMFGCSESANAIDSDKLSVQFYWCTMQMCVLLQA